MNMKMLKILQPCMQCVGYTPGWPLDPYAKSGEQVSLARCPTLILATPSSQPLITSPLPILNLKGLPRSREESNFFPFVRVPKQPGEEEYKVERMELIDKIIVYVLLC